MDIYMPELNGIEATRKIRADLPNTKVLIFTVSMEEIDLFEALRAGATGYVTKDKDFDEIVEAIHAVDRGQMVVPAGMTNRLMKALEEGDPAGLNPEERRILLLIADGRSNREIGLEMSLSERTIRRRDHRPTEGGSGFRTSSSPMFSMRFAVVTALRRLEAASGSHSCGASQNFTGAEPGSRIVTEGARPSKYFCRQIPNDLALVLVAIWAIYGRYRDK